MKVFLPMIVVLFTTLFASAQTPNDLFFSEYVEGSGNNKALEIYNPTNQTIDLSVYYVLRFSNGASTFAEGGATRLSGTLEPFKTFVLVNGQTTSTPTSPACSPVLQALANQLDGVYPAPTYMNGNDAMALVKTPNGEAPNADMSNVTSVDLFGQIGLGAAIAANTGWSYVQDSTLSYNNSNDVPVTGKVVNYIVQKNATDGSSFGPFWMSWTSDHSLIRKSTVVKGVLVNPNPFNVKMEWDTVPAVLDTNGFFVYKDIWTNLGSHECVAASAGIDDNTSGSWFAVYPNPIVSDRFSLVSKLPVKEVEIYGVTGQKFFNQSYENRKNEIEVGPFKLAKGIYIVKVTSSSNVTTVKKILVN
ncbi:MAG: T9SS type A sorting domain-containing protein [Lentimicrobium sp.]|nr:T9SS type A sorting domain-containing protein [Lentimicrobium sp.]